jgi:hypothetical protein
MATPAGRTETPDGTILGGRPLLHPHVEDQPVSRFLSGVTTSGDVISVVIRARTNFEGWAEDV